MTKDIAEKTPQNDNDNEKFFEEIERRSHNIMPAAGETFSLATDTWLRDDHEESNAVVQKPVLRDMVNQSIYSCARLEALKIAGQICHFEKEYDSTAALFKDIDMLHEVADYNLKYIMGDK
jgi:hypothetical protein